MNKFILFFCIIFAHQGAYGMHSILPRSAQRTTTKIMQKSFLTQATKNKLKHQWSKIDKDQLKREVAGFAGGLIGIGAGFALDKLIINKYI